MSDPSDTVEDMFDGSLPEAADLCALSDAELVAASAGWGRVESAAAARKLAAMAEIFCRRTDIDDPDERENWFIDPETSLLNDLAGAHNITEGLARSQTRRGVLLANRFPKVAALFQAGLITDLLIRAIVSRTYLITDPGAMAAVDTALAEQILTWGPKSQAKTEEAIDALVEIHDPGALRRREPATGTRTLDFGTMFDAPGFMTVNARVYTADGVALKERITLMARSVCQDDPRPFKERLNDAFAALQAGTTLRCECDNPDCPASTIDGPTPNIVIHVITTEEALARAQAGQAEAQAAADSGTQHDGSAAAAPEAVSGDAEPESGGHCDESNAAAFAGVEAGSAAQEESAVAVPEESKAVSSSADCKPVHIDPIDEKPVVDEPETGDPTPDAPAVPTPTPAVAYLFGAGVLTPAALPTLLGRARVRPITHRR